MISKAKFHQLGDVVKFLRGYVLEDAESLFHYIRNFMLSTGHHIYVYGNFEGVLLVEPKGNRACEFHIYTHPQARGKGVLTFTDAVRKDLRISTNYRYAFNKVNVDDRQKYKMIRMMISLGGGKYLGMSGHEHVFKTEI